MQPEPDIPVAENASAFARRLGVNRSTICRAIKTGQLVCDAKGLLNVADNLARWSNNAIGSRPDVAARHQAARSAEAQAKNAAARAIQAARFAPSESSFLEKDEDGLLSMAPESLAWFRAQTIRAQNNLVMLRLDLREQRRYRIERISAEAQSLGAVLRSAFDRLVDQTASRLAIERSAETRLKILKSEVHEVRTIFRKEFPRALRRLRSGSSP